MLGYMGRDVEVISLDGNRCLVAACDSCGAVGAKELDAVQISSYIVGRFTARVALLEVLATAARPLLVTVTSANEPQPTTGGILEGVYDELKALDFSETPVVISSEKNMPTRQTGLGITVVGVVERERLRITTSKSGDNLYCLGLPKVGTEVVTHNDPEILQGKHIKALLATPGVHDIVPIGSRGVGQEADCLAAQVGCKFEPAISVEIDLSKSAGPSTCLLFTCKPEFLPPVFLPTPLIKLGRILFCKTAD